MKAAAFVLQYPFLYLVQLPESACFTNRGHRDKLGKKYLKKLSSADQGRVSLFGEGKIERESHD